MAAGSGLDVHDLTIPVIAPGLTGVRVNGSCHGHINYRWFVINTFHLG